MKRLRYSALVAAALLTAGLLCGCSAFSYLTGEYDSPGGTEAREEKESVSIERESVLKKMMEGSGEVVKIKPEQEAGGSVSSEESGEGTVLNEDEILALQPMMAGLYYFDRLPEEEHYLYTQIFYILYHRMELVKIDTLDKDVLDRVFKYVINDHPEIFFVEGYTYTLYLHGDVPSSISFSGTYTMDMDRINSYRTMIDSYTADFLNELHTSGEDLSDEYRIVKFAYEYIINGTEYDTGAPFNQVIISVMVNGRSVCSGYSKTMQYLLRKAGMDATIVLGSMEDGEGHSWNLINCNDAWYYTDPTWGDSSYAKAEGISESKDDPPINYNFLLITTDEILKNHIFDGSVSLPLCASVKDNYYVREGSYFTEVNREQLSALFERAYAEGRDFLPIRMADESIYGEMRKYLLEDQKIFDYVTEGLASVTYVENKEFNYMVFYL